jgi:hypothetical protein
MIVNTYLKGWEIIHQRAHGVLAMKIAGMWRKELRPARWMQWCDRFSLILCRNELPEGERFLEVSTGPDGTDYTVTQRADDTLSVQPWPFEQERFELSVEASYLEQLSFKNDQELLEALKNSTIKDKVWVLRKE